MKTKMKKTSMVYKAYGSVSELRAMMEVPCARDKNAQRLARHVIDKMPDPSWFGLNSAQDCIDALSNGYPEGEARIKAMRKSLSGKLPHAIGVGRVLVRGDRGDELDIHAVNRGDIGNAWTSRQRKVRRTLTNVQILVDICGSSTSSSTLLGWRGTAAATLAEIMTKAKYNTEIVAVWATRNSIEKGPDEEVPDVSMNSCVIKPFGAPLDLSILASTIGLSGFFRTLGFAAIVLNADSVGCVVKSGFGYYCDPAPHLPDDGKVMRIVVPSDVASEKDALDWLIKTVELIESVKGVQ